MGLRHDDGHGDEMGRRPKQSEMEEGMKGRPLIMDNTEREKLRAVVAEAEKNRISLAEMGEIIRGAKMAPGVDPRHEKQWYISHFDYRVFFTIEEQPCGWCRHVSVSVPTPGKNPNPFSVLMIMEALGFTGGWDGADKVYLEDFMNAVNVVQKL